MYRSLARELRSSTQHLGDGDVTLCGYQFFAAYCLAKDRHYDFRILEWCYTSAAILTG
ncbi:hypothetical protein SERLA73DRAFT_129095 [Serpula lacrymans var. lacrymans S7.3]|uniref:Uncharacterized protein n=1 Tax=Serpula lacrymans var. lacrymans (strain S7.3) TaxID=936435 RepID=F8PF57_SERL3|nr:hypothetical protein SERLA73DRAFT_129095 [Serpula lacrymans var. lacrymans S7.3]